ncbi:kelch domain-containing protein [Didymella exigua CBS 183.55]|uniref:Kelch domain-containing protein n=1 Tax=Didymella exigua CBS 183.55 TaxID=1150837 RepID=A0A6A5R9C7_9PLEO|nr:kelch domain-containing protein [Didymella exigua CBS 183.55]KAF1924835.1 kelch domain-containing protein [Didymella exigua CBS 183.55]
MPVSMPIHTLKGNWHKVAANDRLRRSSHAVAVVNGQLHVFGGEVQPRQPVDAKVDTVALGTDPESPAHDAISADNAPSPRVGTASAVLNNALYIFSGRGGADMAPVDEAGAVWKYTPSAHTWEKVSPADASAPVPAGRSYHSSASDGASTVYVHAGCPASGRLSDLWAFDVDRRSWTRLPDAPAPHRGGASMAFANGTLYRMNGFDGSAEVGGSVDMFDTGSRTWHTKTFKPDGADGPAARSVCALLPVQLGGKQKLLTLFGERDPSSLGHAGAGKMLGDVWIYDISEEWWTELHPNAGDDGTPANRGWFDADVVRAEGTGNDSIVVHGGLGDDNERLGDVWLLKF